MRNDLLANAVIWDLSSPCWFKASRIPSPEGGLSLEMAMLRERWWYSNAFVHSAILLPLCPWQEDGKRTRRRGSCYTLYNKEKGKLLYSITTCYFKRVSSPWDGRMRYFVLPCLRWPWGGRSHLYLWDQRKGLSMATVQGLLPLSCLFCTACVCFSILKSKQSVQTRRLTKTP